MKWLLAVFLVACGGAAENDASPLGTLAEACQAGDGIACGELGDAHLNGTHGPKDPVAAKRAYDRGCERDVAPACVNLGVLLEAEDPSAALEAAKKGCRGGDAVGCFNVGSLFTTGTIPVDMERAAEFFDMACGSGHAQACYNLAILYRDGSGVVRDSAASVGHMLRACELEYAVACHALSAIHAQGYSGEPDLKKAALYDRKACDLGLVDACEPAAPEYSRQD